MKKMMQEQLSQTLEWHKVVVSGRELPDNGERVLAYLPERCWFTMVTFINDGAGPGFACHCMMDHGRPTAGTILDVGEEPLYWARLSPSIPLAAWVTEACE